MNTSQLAREKFEGVKPLHHKVILWTLKKYGPAGPKGIQKNAFYVGKDHWDNDRTYILDYHAIQRRLSELRRLKKVRVIDERPDIDGVKRMYYEAI